MSALRGQGEKEDMFLKKSKKEQTARWKESQESVVSCKISEQEKKEGI